MNNTGDSRMLNFRPIHRRCQKVFSICGNTFTMRAVLLHWSIALPIIQSKLSQSREFIQKHLLGLELIRLRSLLTTALNLTMIAFRRNFWMLHAIWHRKSVGNCYKVMHHSPKLIRSWPLKVKQMQTQMSRWIIISLHLSTTKTNCTNWMDENRIQSVMAQQVTTLFYR